MSRRAVGLVTIAVLVGLLLATVTTSGGVNLWIAPDWEPAPATVSPSASEPTAEPEEPEDEPEQDDGSALELPGWVTEILNVLGVAAVIVGLILLARSGWHRRPKLRWGERASGHLDFEVLPDVAEVVVDEAEAQRAALLTGAPRNAIVRCWLRLERDVATAGLTRRPSDTSAEFTERVLALYSVDSRAIRDLAALYREARFSEHALDESARDAALDALDRLHRELIGGSGRGASGEVQTEDAP